jgi:heme-degrading monooxygenase HmoA
MGRQIKESAMPVHAVIFEVKPDGEAGREAYLAEAARLLDKLQTMPGFMSVERFKNLTREGWMLSLSKWRDEAALVGWRENHDHRAAQEKGRHEIFEDYRIRVVRQVGAGGDLTLTEQWAPSGTPDAQNFDSLRIEGHRIALIGGGAGAGTSASAGAGAAASEGDSGTHWEVIRDYGMHDRRQAPRK